MRAQASSRKCTKEKVIQFRVFGALIPRAITLSISHMGGQPTSFLGIEKRFRLNYKGNGSKI